MTNHDPRFKPVRLSKTKAVKVPNILAKEGVCSIPGLHKGLKFLSRLDRLLFKSSEVGEGAMVEGIENSFWVHLTERREEIRNLFCSRLNRSLGGILLLLFLQAHFALRDHDGSKWKVEFHNSDMLDVQARPTEMAKARESSFRSLRKASHKSPFVSVHRLKRINNRGHRLDRTHGQHSS